MGANQEILPNASLFSEMAMWFLLHVAQQLSRRAGSCQWKQLSYGARSHEEGSARLSRVFMTEDLLGRGFCAKVPSRRTADPRKRLTSKGSGGI